MADIDELKFSIILDDNKFKQKMEEVNAAAEKFEKSVKAALAVQNLLDAAQSKGAKSTEKVAESAKKSADAAERQSVAAKELLNITQELAAANQKLSSSTEKVAESGKERSRINEKLIETQRALSKAMSDSEVYLLRQKTGFIHSSDIDLMKKFLDLVKELKKQSSFNANTDTRLWSTCDADTLSIVEKLAKKWGEARSEVEKYFRTFKEVGNAKYSFSFDDHYGLYNLGIQERGKDSDYSARLKEINDSATSAKKSIKELSDEENRLQTALDSANEKLAEEKQQMGEAQSAVTQLASAKKRLEEASKTTNSSTSKAEVATMKELAEEEEKVYKLVELRRKRKEQSGQLTNDEVQVLKQMESIEKALLNIREQHKGKLAEEFSIMMNEEGMTRQQVGSYQSLVTQMQAATNESAKREAAEKAALTLREQKENAILALKRTLAGVNQELLSAETKINIQKGQSGELTAKEIASLQIAIATENKRYAAQKRADAEKQAAENALIGLRRTLVGINQKILSEEVKQKIAKAEAGQLTSKEISQLNAQIALEKSKTNEMERQRASAASISSQLTRQTSIMKGLTSYVAQYASIFGAVTILRNLIRITGEFEAQHVALRAILQDSVAADNIYNQLQVLAVKSPYTFQNLVSYAKQLTAFSIPVNEVYETTKKLADVSAGLGVDMGRIILAYGQVRSAEFLRGQEVRQFTEAGIPILSELAKQFSEIEGHAISVGEVFNRISARQVPFEMVEEAFNRMTSAGGKFYNMQEVLAETVKGKISNLQDAWEIMLSKIGNEKSGTIKGIVTMLTGLFANYEKWIGYVSAAVKGLGLYTAALAATNGITKGLNTTQALHNSLQIIKNAQLKLSTILIPTNNAVQKTAIANNMTEAATLATLNVARQAALGILSMLATVGFLVYQKFKRMREENEALSRSMDELTRSYRENLVLFSDGWGTLEKTHGQYKDGKKTVQDYKDALNDLYKKFPNFIDENVRQKIAVEDLAGAWDAATQNMKQYYAENASHQAHEILLKDYKEDTNKIVEDLNAQLRTRRKFAPYRKNGLINEGSIQLLDAYVMGLKTKDELSEDLQRLVELLNSVGEEKYSTYIRDKDAKLKKVDVITRDRDNIIDKARDNYLARMQEFREAVEKADADIEKDFTSTRNRQVREYLLKNGIAEDSDLMMRSGTDDFESWQSWQGRLRKMYKDTGEENQKVIEKMFSHFGLVVSEDGLTPAQSAVSEWIKKNPAPDGVSMASFEIKPETNVAEFAEKALKQMQDDAKALARLPKEFQKTEGQGWNEYAKMLKDKGDATSAARARGIQYFERMSQEIWEDDVFGSTKELLKKEKQSKKSWEEFRRDKIADLKQQSQDLKEMKSAYDQFKSLGFNDNQIGGLLTNYFGKRIPEGGFGNTFESLAKEMDKYSANDAKDIRNYAAGKGWKENAKSIEEAQKATEKFRESLEDLAATTKRLNLEGFAAELDKIVVDTDSKNRKLRTDWSQKLDDLSKSKDGWIAKFRVEHPDQDAERAWEDFYAAQKKALDELIQTQIEYNNKVAQGQIDKKAESWMKEMMDKNNINLSDMGDKSLAQVNVLIERMQTLVSDEALSKLLPPELKQDAELINASFSKLLSNVKKIANTKLGDLRVEKMKKTMDGVKALMSTLGISADTSAVSESYSTLSQRLTEVADAQQEVADAQVKYNAAKREGDLDREAEAYTALAMAVGKYQSASEAAQNAQREFVTTLAVASVGVFASGLGKVGDMLKKIGEASEDADLVGLGDAMSRVSQNLNAAAAGFAAAYSAGAGAYSWIGAVVGGLSDIIGQIATATSEHTKMLTENKERLKDYYVAYHATLLEMEEFTNIFGEQVSRSARDAYDKMIAAADKARKYYSQLKNSKVITDHKGAWESGNTEWWYLRTLYPGLFDEDGHINTDLASRLIKDLPTGGKSRDWNSDLRDTLQLAIDAENAWKEAKEALDGYISSFTGDWASSLAEVMWNAVASGEDAWEEWHDVASEAISDIGKQMLTEMIQKAWLSQYQKELEDAFSSGDSPDEIWAKVAEISERMFKDVDNNHEKLYNITKEFQDRMAAAGYEVNGAESDSSVANGIKSITEDTANLLASYVNAIRADVSYGRIQWGRIAVAVEGQANRYATLNDYLAKVQADTANIAASNQKILESLDGFVRDFSMASDYGDSLKVQIVN